MNYSFLLRKVGVVVVLINSLAFDFKSFSGKPDLANPIAFNSNYYWKGIPIGIITGLKSTIGPEIKGRPIFTIKPDGTATIVPTEQRVYKALLEAQAGPWVLRAGELVAIKDQSYSSDSLRNAPRVVLGTRPDGKTVVYFTDSVVLKKVGQIMRDFGCQDAMALDGGSSSALWVGPEFWGRRHSAIPAGVYLSPKRLLVKARMGPP